MATEVPRPAAELERAVAMLHEMGMAHWLPEAEAKLAAVTASTDPLSG